MRSLIIVLALAVLGNAGCNNCGKMDTIELVVDGGPRNFTLSECTTECINRAGNSLCPMAAPYGSTESGVVTSWPLTQAPDCGARSPSFAEIDSLTRKLWLGGRVRARGAWRAVSPCSPGPAGPPARGTSALGLRLA